MEGTQKVVQGFVYLAQMCGLTTPAIARCSVELTVVVLLLSEGVSCFDLIMRGFLEAVLPPSMLLFLRFGAIFRLECSLLLSGVVVV